MSERFCQRCGSPIPDDAPPRTRFCRECVREKKREWQRANYCEHKAEYNAYTAETYQYYKSRGICVSCHRRSAIEYPDGTRSIYCETCAEKNRKSNRRWRKKKKEKA